MRYDCSVRGCVVLLERQIARTPQFKSCSPNVLPQMAKNTTVEPVVHGLAFRAKVMVHNPSDVGKQDEHGLGRAVALPHLLQSWGSWALPLRILLFVSGSYPYTQILSPMPHESYFKSPRFWCDEFHTEFDVCCLLHFHVHAEIADVKSVWWQTLVLCNSQCSHSDATRHTEWRSSLLPSTTHAFMYCHQLACRGTSLKHFWCTYVIQFFVHEHSTVFFASVFHIGE